MVVEKAAPNKKHIKILLSSSRMHHFLPAAVETTRSSHTAVSVEFVQETGDNISAVTGDKCETHVSVPAVP